MKSSCISTAILLVAALGLAGCGRSDKVKQPPRAKSATVQFRRDFLGASMDLPVSPATDGINGAMVSMSGKLKMVNEEWVVLGQAKEEIWIPRENVLLIKIN